MRNDDDVIDINIFLHVSIPKIDKEKLLNKSIDLLMYKKSEQKSKISNSPKLLSIGIEDYYSKGGSYKFLLEKHSLTSDKIALNILNNYNR